MFFNSYEFIFILLPISLFLYWGSCYFNLKKYANLTLLIISIIFYINLTDIIGIIVILISIILNFSLYKVLENNTRYRKSFFIIGVLINIGMLGYFKYANFFIDNINSFFNFDMSITKLIAPVGMSFFTFQKISFISDTYHKELLIKAYEAEANDPDCPYCWYDTVNFGKKYWINDYQYNDYSNVPIKQLSDEEKEIIDKNVSGLINTIKMNPDTNFKIFIPPYSIIYWYRNKGEGKIIYQLDVQLYVYKKLLKFENVKIYYFQNDLNIVENLDNYKDYTHYSESISEYILAAIANEKNILTKDNIDNTLQQFRNYLVTYDFSKIFD